MINILEILASIISSVPEAIALYEKIAPHINVSADIPADKVAEINTLAHVAASVVGEAHKAIAELIDAHGPIEPVK